MFEESIRVKCCRPLDVAWVSKKLNAPERTVRWWAEHGILPARRLGIKVWVFERADIEAFIKKQQRKRGR